MFGMTSVADRRLRAGAGGAGAVVVVSAVGAGGFEVRMRGLPLLGLGERIALFRLVAALAFGIPGAVIARSRPRNPIGWLLLLVGLLNGVSLVAEDWGLFGVYHRWPMPGAPWVL